VTGLAAAFPNPFSKKNAVSCRGAAWYGSCPPDGMPVVQPTPPVSNPGGRRIITFGTFDLFHVGHVNVLRRARALGDWLIVGVSSDELNASKKGRRPFFSIDERLAIVGNSRVVDEVFVEESLELKADYLREHRADVLVMGDDWQGRFDHYGSICEVIYLPRTPEISSTQIITVVRADIHAA
jgi:glycerol-3-phosphate cytidylyltransferase